MVRQHENATQRTESEVKEQTSASLAALAWKVQHSRRKKNSRQVDFLPVKLTSAFLVLVAPILKKRVLFPFGLLTPLVSNNLFFPYSWAGGRDNISDKRTDLTSAE